MAKAKATPVQDEKLITLTKEQYQAILEVRELLDDASDSLNDIDGDDNLYEIGKAIGSVYSDIILAYNSLSTVVEDKQNDAFEFDFEEEN